MNYWIYDIETLPNLFVICFLSVDTQEEKTFIIFKEQSDLPFWEEVNQIKELKEFLRTVKGLIGYNNIGFDYQVLHQLLKTKTYDTQYLLDLQYNTANEIINSQEDRLILVWEQDYLIPQLDLFLIWHYNNKARATSLKWLQYSMDYPNIEEMSVNHNNIIQKQQINDIVNYCKNDVDSTYKFFLATQGKTEHPLYKNVDKLQLRANIQKETNLNCWNWNDVKIGENLLKQDYCKETNTNPKELKDYITNFKSIFTFKECFPEYAHFKTTAFNNFINSFKDEIVPQEFEKIFKYNNTEYTFALGGLHSNDSKRILQPTLNQILRDCDVGSMYPNRIRKGKLYPLHLSPEWNKNYQSLIEKRIRAKQLFKETKEGKYQAIQEAYKLAMNGG